MSNLSPITFHGDTIYCITHNNEPYTPVKPIIQNLGLDWQSQATKIRMNKTRWGVVIITIPSMVNITIEKNSQETCCMPVRKLPAFLATINPKKVKAELREKIELYQNECDNALWDYWTKGEAKRNQQLPQEPSTERSAASDRRQIFSLVGKWAKKKGMFHKDCWKAIHKEFGLKSISELPKNKIHDVCSFIAVQMGESLAPAVQNTNSLLAPKPELTFLPAEQKLPPLMFEYEPADWKKDWVEFHARQMLERYDYKTYAYNAYMLSCKAADIFDDFEKKIKELMKDYAKISKPVYKEMFSKVMNGDYEDMTNTNLDTKEERDRHNSCANFTSTMWQTLDSTYAKFMYSRSGDLRNEVDQMIQTLRHTAKILDM